MRHMICESVQLRIVELLTAGNERPSVRSPLRLGLEQVVYTTVALVWRVRTIPLSQSFIFLIRHFVHLSGSRKSIRVSQHHLADAVRNDVGWFGVAA
jgi:hypothetical protein